MLISHMLNVIENYFLENKKILELNYPGLTYPRFELEYLRFTQSKKNSVILNLRKDFISLLEKAKPFEYINNNSFFYKSNFYVSESVLIPRSETEILVADSIGFIKENYHEEFKIAEIGVGSFNMSLSILSELNFKVKLVGGDISPSALNIAKINYFRHKNKIHPETQVDLVESDRLSCMKEKFNLIIANPPYIKQSADRAGVHAQTLEHEPHQALFLKDQEYNLWFNQLFTQVHKALKVEGAFFMEGHEDHLEMLKIMALQYFNRAEVKKDYTKRDRFLYCYK